MSDLNAPPASEERGWLVPEQRREAKAFYMGAYWRGFNKDAGPKEIRGEADNRYPPAVGTQEQVENIEELRRHFHITHDGLYPEDRSAAFAHGMDTVFNYFAAKAAAPQTAKPPTEET